MAKTKVTFIILGKKRNRDKLMKQIHQVFDQKFELEFRITSKNNNAKLQSIDALKNGTDVMIAAGGDGTLNEVVNGVMHSNATNDVKIGVLPFGNGNDFARNVGFDKNLNRLYETVEKGQIELVDIGKLSFTGHDNEKDTRYFINIADVGIGGLVSKNVNNFDSILNSNLTYMYAIVRAFLTYRHQKLNVQFNDINWEGKALSVCMANSKYFGSGIGIAPDADYKDGLAELVILGDVSLTDYVKNLSKLKKCQKIHHPELHYHRTTNCKITTEKPIPIDMDGEFIGFTPLEMEMIPAKIQLLKI